MSQWYGYPIQFSISTNTNINQISKKEEMRKELKEIIDSKHEDESCYSCIQFPPCRTQVKWTPQFYKEQNVGTQFINWTELTNGKYNDFEIGHMSHNVLQKDLNENYFNYSRLFGSERPAESVPTSLLNRVQFARFLQSSQFPVYSPHEKRIDSIGDAFGALNIQKKHIQFSSF
jgi:hypothetical protein